jgi:hypothetical protein
MCRDISKTVLQDDAQQAASILSGVCADQLKPYQGPLEPSPDRDSVCCGMLENYRIHKNTNANRRGCFLWGEGRAEMGILAVNRHLHGL